MIRQCAKCEFWNTDSRPPEVFGWARWRFDIDKAKRLCAVFSKPASFGRKAMRPKYFPIADLAAFIQWPPRTPIQGWAALDFRRPIDPAHVEHVDIDLPVILATPTMGLEKIFRGSPGFLMLIDGAHRVAKAMQLGIPGLDAYVLNERATRFVLDVEEAD